MVSYTIKRSSRKTIAIYIKKDAIVEVRAPFAAPKDYIDRFVSSKENWITKQLSTVNAINCKKSAFSLEYGNMLTVFGKEYIIREKEGMYAYFDGECVYIPLGLRPDDIKSTVIQVYKMVLKQFLMNRIDYYARIMDVVPTAVRVTNAKTRWASCSGRNSLNFTWRLAMADEALIDYVIVHELAHIKEHNHSFRFWAIVEGIMPDYDKHSQGLDLLMNKLSHEDWD